ncbi:MAG: hypothetical protein ACHQ7N_10895 [Candidatus Methylomirabilales bacterium]
MNRDAFATVLLSGWLLMLPPADDGGVKVEAPVATWTVQEAFDTAAACEGRKKEKISSFEKWAQDQKPPEDEKARRFINQVITSYIYARCVPADHIYPPKKPGD